MFVSSEAVDHLVTATTIWHVEVVRKPLSQANKLWCNTTRDNPCPRAFLDEFIQKIRKGGGVCKTNSFQRAVRTEMPEGHEHRSDDYETENVDGKEVHTNTKRAQKAKMHRAQGNELCHKGEGDVLRLVPATDMKYHYWSEHIV